MGDCRKCAHKLATRERRYDARFKGVFEAIRQLMNPPPLPKRSAIGFVLDEE